MTEIKRPTRISMPQSAKRGEVIEIKTLIQHEMETGYRRDAEGKTVPRDIIQRLSVQYDGVEIFSAETFTGISANPYLAFSTIATATGDLVFTWTDLSGATTTEIRKLTVT